MTVQWHLSNNMIPDSPLPSEYGDDEYGAFNCAGEQMPVHEDARNTKQRCDKRLIIGKPLGGKAHQAILAEGAANVYARLRNKSRQFGRNPPTWPLRRASDFERCRHSQDPVRLQSGAGSRPCVLRMLPIVVSQMLSPTFDSAPLIRSYPHVGFSFTNWAVRSTVTCRLWSPRFLLLRSGSSRGLGPR